MILTTVRRSDVDFRRALAFVLLAFAFNYGRLSTFLLAPWYPICQFRARSRLVLLDEQSTHRAATWSFAQSTMANTSSSRLSLQAGIELYMSVYGIRLALQSRVHEQKLLDLRGDIAIKCMDQMLLVSTSSVVFHSHLTCLY